MTVLSRLRSPEPLRQRTRGIGTKPIGDQEATRDGRRTLRRLLGASAIRALKERAAPVVSTFVSSLWLRQRGLARALPPGHAAPTAAGRSSVGAALPDRRRRLLLRGVGIPAGRPFEEPVAPRAGADAGGAGRSPRGRPGSPRRCYPTAGSTTSRARARTARSLQPPARGSGFRAGATAGARARSSSAPGRARSGPSSDGSGGRVGSPRSLSVLRVPTSRVRLVRSLLDRTGRTRRRRRRRRRARSPRAPPSPARAPTRPEARSSRRALA